MNNQNIDTALVAVCEQMAFCHNSDAMKFLHRAAQDVRTARDALSAGCGVSSVREYLRNALICIERVSVPASVNQAVKTAILELKECAQ